MRRWDAAPSCGGVPDVWRVLMSVPVSTLGLVDFRALRVHVGVVQRVASGVAVGRRQVLWRVGARRLRLRDVVESV